MKTKLLKKIRKRFDYYIGSKGDYVLVDKMLELVVVLDKDTLLKQYPYYATHEDEITKDIYFNFLKVLMYRPYIKDAVGKRKFNYAKRKLKNKYNATT